MAKNKKFIYYLTLIPLLIIIVLFAWLFTVIFEGEKPSVMLTPLPGYISQKQEFQVNVNDMKRGIKALRISYSQGNNDTVLLEMKFPFEGFLNKNGVREYNKTFQLDPSKLRLAQGKLDLNIKVWDYSRRNGGDGNMNVIKHSMIVDTYPPSLRAISKSHYVSIGGTGLVIYRTSSDTAESGLYVNDIFFEGYPAGENAKEGTYLAYFALPFNVDKNAEIHLWAKDKAGNTARSTFYYKILSKRFNKDKIDVSDNLLKRVLPYFDYLGLDPALSDKDKYIKINTELRKKDNETLYELLKDTTPTKLWEGKWLRMKNAASMAQFADHRSYYYNGEKIDEQDHMGIDLASLANSPIEAANNGIVVFAERNGIYGMTVVLDHGQGLASLYGHLSSIDVKIGDTVKKGDILGHSGQTGLAVGDHLHFSVLVHGIFVNPVEWWDLHWIQDNILRKLDLIKNAE
ncbi:MAG: M23 family metallopeptidase [Desulfobacteraceae bacterium]|jgi:murein DD-endopeptidase MepM/ murein hydrolase activator NlpD